MIQKTELNGFRVNIAMMQTGTLWASLIAMQDHMQNFLSSLAPFSSALSVLVSFAAQSLAGHHMPRILWLHVRPPGNDVLLLMNLMMFQTVYPMVELQQVCTDRW
ncbi:hypothetical protein B0H10DRAFT_2222201 [Mycena sp. CBHHK59/15]|nr:hypothetical protein B0H10DRAFT_2222201 [Mycena sp. CBHHK59/15]